MPITLQRREPKWLLSLEGRIDITSAAELKALLLEWLAAAKDLELDLQRAEQIDITIMQLLWAASREAVRSGVRISGCASDVVAEAVRDAGFVDTPEFLRAAISSEEAHAHS